MSVDIEPLIERSGLRYTKEVDPKGGVVRFGLPFDSQQGPIVVRVENYGDFLSVSAFLRSMDSIAVQGAVRDLLTDLLKLNAGPHGLARVGLWVLPQDETQWILVVSELPGALANQGILRSMVEDVAGLAEQVLMTIETRRTSRQTQLG